MPITKPNLEYTQLGLGEAFDALKDPERTDPTEAARISDTARSALMTVIKSGKLPHGQYWDGGLPPWLDVFLDLLNKGWPWRQAVYIAWEASPRGKRWPETQEELATDVLGLSSDRVISTWRSKNPNIDTMVATLQSAQLFYARAGVLAALVQSAETADYKNHPDRKLYLEMTGDYVPISQLKAMMLKGEFKANRDIEDLSTDELLALAGGDFAVLMKEKEAADVGGDNESNAQP